MNQSNVSANVADNTSINTWFYGEVATPTLHDVLNAVDIPVHLSTHRATGLQVKLNIGWGIVGR